MPLRPGDTIIILDPIAKTYSAALYISKTSDKIVVYLKHAGKLHRRDYEKKHYVFMMWSEIRIKSLERRARAAKTAEKEWDNQIIEWERENKRVFKT